MYIIFPELKKDSLIDRLLIDYEEDKFREYQKDLLESSKKNLKSLEYSRLEITLSKALSKYLEKNVISRKEENSKSSIKIIRSLEEFEKVDFYRQKILFAVQLNEYGINFEYFKIVEYIRRVKEGKVFEKAVSAIIIDSASELYTKDIARQLGFSLNMAGSNLIGKALVEGAGELKNFETLSKIHKITLKEVYEDQIYQLIIRLLNYKEEKKNTLNLLLLHSSDRKSSNTLMLWDKIKKNLSSRITVEEISLNRAGIRDCRGCPYDTCLHFGKQEHCYYGGIIAEEVYPKILEADIIVLACPNYNDSISANLMATINRMTAISISHNIRDKYIYAAIVSGYSGGDIVAMQILGAFNFNKGLEAKSRFALLEIANDKGSILKVENIDEKAKAFASNVNSNLR